MSIENLVISKAAEKSKSIIDYKTHPPPLHWVILEDDKTVRDCIYNCIKIPCWFLFLLFYG